MTMSRPKGSKNKKTLLKLAQQAKEMQQKASPPKKRKKFSLSDENEVPQIDSKETDSITAQNTHFVQSEKSPEKLHLRSEKEYIAGLSDKQVEKMKKCKKCGEVILGDPHRVDTYQVTGVSPWHREHPRYVELCGNCAKELSELVDNWLGKDYPTKWEDNEGGY